ncbi:MAG: hypothetical protein IJX89_01200 [Alphaproteobacteria bacterium]|nr:hypothetical protein [Alphaproteobacteria bacterium]
MVYSTDSDNWQNATDVDFHIVTTRYPYAEYYNYMAIENKRADNNEKLADLSKQKIKKLRRECAASQGARITSVYDCSLESKAAVAEQEMMNAGVVVSGQTWSVSGQ